MHKLVLLVLLTLTITIVASASLASASPCQQAEDYIVGGNFGPAAQIMAHHDCRRAEELWYRSTVRLPVPRG